MKRWYLLWECLVVLSFQIGLLRLKKGRSIFIGMNRRFRLPKPIDPAVIRSARRAIAEDVSWRTRFRWWRQEHPGLRRFCLPIMVFCLSAFLGVPILFGAEVLIDGDPDFAGYADYDPQVFGNSSGDLVCIYSRGRGFNNTRQSMKYSQDGGSTWSTRVVLFSAPSEGEGIIDANTGGMWEFSGQVLNDVLYLTNHLKPGGGSTRIGFFKCDISDVTNITDFQNWKSANGNSPPSEGNGSDGNGYDIVQAAGYIDPSIGVQSPNSILISTVKEPPIDDKLYGTCWDGDSWSGKFTIKQFSVSVNAVPSVRYMRDGDWIVSVKLDGSDNVIMRCDSADDITISANWTRMDGTGGFDYIISHDTYNFTWPTIQVDSKNRVHVVAITTVNIDGHKRLWHNYWKEGTGWVNGEGEHNAGSRIGAEHPKCQGGTIALNADSGGNIIMLYALFFAPDDGPGGTYSMFWKDSTESWDLSNQVRESDIKFSTDICQEGYMRGIETVAPFIVNDDTSTKVYYIGVSGAQSGSPWWDRKGVPSGNAGKVMSLMMGI